MQSRTFEDIRLVCLGSPLIDVTANVDDPFLQKYHLEPDNAYVIDENTRTIFEDMQTCSVQVGGSVTNTVRTVRMLRDSPRGLIYLGTVGNDHYGEFIKMRLAKEGLGDNLKTIQGNTGKVAVLLRGKARTLVTDLGVSRHFPMDDNITQLMNEPNLFYLSGFFISVSIDIISALIDRNKTIAFNLGAPFLCAKFPKEMVHLYRNSCVVFGNEAEHRAFGGLYNITSNDIQDVVQETNQLHGNKSRVVVVTRGGRSVLVLQDSDWLEFEIESLNEEEIVDSNGAGDAFVGGFLARYIEGDSIASCVKCAIEIAREIVKTVGFNPNFYNSIL